MKGRKVESLVWRTKNNCLFNSSRKHNTCSFSVLEKGYDIL